MIGAWVVMVGCLSGGLGASSVASVCRRWSGSTSFMLAALRVLHVDASGASAWGGMDRGRAGCGQAVAGVGVVMSGRLVVGAVEQVGEQLGAVGLALRDGVVVLG